MKKNSKKLISLILAFIIQITSLNGIVLAKTDNQQPIKTKSMLVMYKNGVQDSEQKIKNKKIKGYKKLKKKDTYVVNIDEADIAELQNDESILFVENDALLQKSDDKITWNIKRVNAQNLHDSGYFGEGIKVAVFDTGIDTDNFDLQVAGGISFVEGITSYDDDNGHGTAMAGILSASINQQGIIGVAPKIELYAVKVLDSNGVGSYSNIIQGLEWAVENDIDIVAMSFGGDEYSGILKDTVINAKNNDIMMIAAAGNQGSDSIQYPAKYPDVICVGAVDGNNKIASFSNYGEKMDIVAPGIGIETIRPDGSPILVEGTSASVQHVAGVAALIWGAKKELDSQQLKAILLKNATPLGDSNKYGWGIVNASQAIDNINTTDYSLPYSEYEHYEITSSEEGDEQVNISYKYTQYDYQHIYPGQSVTVRAGFYSSHNTCTVTTYKATNPSNILHSETRGPIYANAYMTYTCPSGILNEVGTYNIRYHCPDNNTSQYDDVFTIYVDPRPATPTPSPQPTVTPPPTNTDDYGNSTSTATIIAVGSTKYGSINYVSDADFFKFTTSVAGYYTIESHGSTDVKGRLYDSSGIELVVNDDDGEGNNFLINKYLNANSTYYFSVRHFNDSSTGAYYVSVTAPTVQIPQTPTNVSVASTNNSATVAWPSVTGATGYDIQRDGYIYYDVTTPYIHSGLIPNTSHTYKVRAKNSAGYSSWSSTASIWTLANQPVSGSFDSVTANSIKVLWGANGNPTGTQYTLIVKKYGNIFTGWQQVGSDILTTATQYTVTGLESDVEYLFQVKAVNGADVESSLYEIGKKKTLPPVPEKVSGLKTDQITQNSVKVNWSTVSGATGYDIEKDSVLVNDASRPYTHTGLSANTKHTYRVRAKNAGGNGIWSDYFETYTYANIPSSGKIDNKTANSITASWQANGNAAGTEYAVEVRKKSFLFWWTQVNTDKWSTSLNATVGELNPNTLYQVVVKARNKSGIVTDVLVIEEVTTASAGTPSVTPTITPPGVSLSMPKLSVDVVDKNTLLLKWNAVQGATGYDITRYNITIKRQYGIEDSKSFTVEQATSFRDTGLLSGNTYGYMIRAKNATTYGAWTNVVETTTPPSSIPKEQDTVLDPVNITTGNFYTNNTDISISDRGPSLEISRHYSSRDTLEGILGKGWRIGYESSVSENSETGMVTVIYPNGRMLHYYPNESSGYTTPEGVFDTLVKNTDGSFTLELQNKTKYSYNIDGKLSTIADRNNNILTLEYNTSAQLTKVYGAGGKWLGFTYLNGMLKEVSDNSGRKVAYTYTLENLLQSFKDTAGNETVYAYDSNGLLTSITDQNGNTYVSNQYDEKGRVILQLDEKGNESTINYDDVMMVNTVTRVADGRTTVYFYNEKYQVTKKIFEDGTYEEYTYDEYGNKKTISDRNGNTTTNTYDARGNLLSVVTAQPYNYQTLMTYDANDNMVSLQTPEGASTTFEYDSKGNLIKLIKKLDEITNAITSYTYDNYGRLISMTDPEGNTTTYEYASGKNPVKVIDPEGNITSYSYDAVGRRISVTTAYGTSHYEYDSRDKIIKITDPLGNATRMKYDANGNLVTLIKPEQYNSSTDNGLGTTYAYDEMDRLIKQIDHMGNVSAYQYDMDGNKTKEINPNYYSQTSNDGEGLSFEYDETGKLVRIVYPSGQKSRIVYDAVGNQTKVIDANQYDESTDTGIGMQYIYDALNRPETVKDTDGNIVKKNLYDADGRIIKEIDAKGYLSGTTDITRYGTVYQYNYARWLMEKRSPEKDENGNIYYSVKRYTYNKNGKVLEEKTSPEFVTLTGEPANWDTVYYTYDKNSKVKTVADDTGSYMEYAYDALGNTVLEKIKLNQTKFKVTRYQYDAAGRMTKSQNEIDASDIVNGGSGIILAEILYEYDKNGNVIKATRPEGYVTTFEYDAADRLIAKHEEVTQDTLDVKGTTVSISGDRNVMYHNQQYSYTVQIDASEAVKGISAEVDYDARLLEVVSVSPSVSGLVINTNTIGKVQLFASGMNATGKLTLATLIFKAKEGNRGAASISINTASNFTDSNGAQQGFTALAGKRVLVRMLDMNEDESVELNDFTVIAKLCGTALGETAYEEKYDINGSGIIDDGDLDIMTGYLFNDQNILPALVQTERFNEIAVQSSYTENRNTVIRTTTYEYDKAGNIIKETDTNGNSINYTYDVNNRLIKVTDKEGNTTRIFYDEVGNKIKEISPKNYNASTDDGTGIAYTYDTMNRLLEVRNEMGIIVTRNTYDITGLITSSADAIGNTTDYTYDIAGRALTVTTPESKAKGLTSIQYTYDAKGNITDIIDGEGNITSYIRDMWGRATEITKADGTNELYSFDLAGNMVASTDGNGNTTHYTYNSMNKLSTITDPKGQTVTYKYDKEGRRVLEQNRNGKVITYIYNGDNSLTYKGIAGANEYQKYLYNADGSLLASINQNAVESYTYTQNGLLKSKAQNGRLQLSYDYDKNGQIVSITGQNQQLGYNYDALGRLVTVKDGQTIIAEYTYNQDNTVAGIHYNNGITVSYGYDRNKNVTSLVNRTSQGNSIGEYTYTYDNNGNIKSKVENGETTAYTYDALSRLLSENDTTYSYDNAGNRTSKTDGAGTTTYTYDNRNRMTASTIAGTTTTYSYDNNGNLLTSSDGKSYNYDGFDRLVETSIETNTATVDTAWQINLYGPDGLRMGLIENGIYTGFTTDRGKAIAETNARGDITKSYIRGYALAAMKDTTGLSYYTSNAHGDVTAITANDGSILNSYSYDAFGNTIGNTINSTQGIDNRFMYAGEQLDSVTGEYYLRARYYNPVVGRFTQEDTYRGDGLNLYAYVANNPLRYVDPSGHSKDGVNSGTGNSVKLSVDDLKPSEELVDFVSQYEGYSQYAYADKDGQMTIGYGHVLLSGENYPNGISKEEAKALLLNEIKGKYCSASLDPFLKKYNIRLTQYEYDALVSFTYNVGQYIWDRIPEKFTLKRYIMNGDTDPEAIKSALVKWVIAYDADGRAWKAGGLWRRRMDEAEMFSVGDYVRDDRPIPTGQGYE